MNELTKEIRNLKRNIRKIIDPTSYCIECSSKNIIMTKKGLETDMYKCLNCKKEYGLTDIMGF